LTLPWVTAYVVAYCQGRNTWSAKAMVTALRSLLRYLHVSGRVPTSLAGAVPAVAGWRLAALPRGLMVGQVEALIASCDLQVAVGVRDHAVLVVLARLGLRTAEVAALGLQDVDWRAGQVLIRGKGGRVERLPLPVAVGHELVDQRAFAVALVDVGVVEVGAEVAVVGLGVGQQVPDDGEHRVAEGDQRLLLAAASG
jgi:site-specific recombinase XerC